MKLKAKRVLLLLASIAAVCISLPFYFLYAVGKTLFDLEGYADFFGRFWYMILIPDIIENEKSKLRTKEKEGNK